MLENRLELMVRSGQFIHFANTGINGFVFD